VTAQRLDRVLKAYRIGDPKGAYPIFDAAGSKLAPGRCNTAATAVTYCSEHYSTAMLEKLVHGSGALPPHQHYVEITIGNGTLHLVTTGLHHPVWWDRRLFP
jgi:RES domain-containing protein